MKFKSSVILVLAALWGSGSWWWYTCQIKGFCSMQTTPQTALNSNVTNEDPAQDNDKDGILNGDEKRLGTDINNPDSDEDGVPDVVEISQVPNDTDGDGLIDALDDDDDNDGILTKDESPDPNNDGKVADALDADKNGVPNYLQASKTAINTNKGSTNKNDTKSVKVDTPTPPVEAAPAVTTITEEGSVDIYRPEPQASAMTSEEEKRLNKGTPSPAPVVPAPPETLAVATETTTPSSTTSSTETTSKPSTNNSSTKPTTTETTSIKPASTTTTETSDAKTTALGIKTPETKLTTETKPNTETAKPNTAEKAPEESKTEEPKTNTKSDTEKDEVEPQDPEGKDKNKMVVYQKGESTPNRIGPARLNFPTNATSPALSDETAQYFDAVAAYLQKHKRATIKITGHTDNKGDADLNEKLGLKRAEIVKNALIKRGAPEEQIRVISMGESKPIASNNTQEGRQQNRRVEIMPLK